MPKCWRPKPTEKERLDTIAAETSKIIRRAMVDQNIPYQMDLADRLGMSRSTMSSKLKTGAWTQRDLCRIVSVLKIPPEDAVRMLGA